MTDNDIVKALECCSKLPQRCKECPLMIPGGCGIINKYELALDLINRQKAEIERVRVEKDNLIRTYKECQIEAVKEFAERLKEHYPHSYSIAKRIDCVAQEMVGNENDTNSN